jgi:large subunit ribosomal protein L4
MAEVTRMTQSGQDKGKVTLAEELFGVRPRQDLMHEAVRSALDNRRLGTHSTLTRSEVDYSGKKPWRQKGTGRARSGTKGSPVWRGGGIAFGPKPRSYTHHLPRKARRLAVTSALATQAAAGAVMVLDSLSLTEGRTKAMAGVLKALGLEARKTLFVLPVWDGMVARAAGNLPRVRVRSAREVNAIDILDCERVVIVEGALDALKERCS